MQGDYSLDELRTAAEAGNSDAALTLADHHAERAEWNEAEEMYRLAAELGNSAGLDGLGRVLIELDRLNEAEDAFRAALGAGVAEAGLELAIVLTMRGGPDDFEEAEALCRRADIEGIEAALLNYGNLLAKWSGREGEAEHLYRLCLERGEQPAHNNLGVLYQAMGREDEAEAEFRAGAEAGDSLAWKGLGALLHEQERYDEAEEALKTALATGCAEARWPLIDLYLDLGRTEDAEREYLTTIAKGDDDSRVDLGILYQNVGRYEEAEREYRAAIEAGITRAHISLGNLLDEAYERHAEAEEQYRLAIAAAAHLPNATYNLAVCLDHQGRAEEAMEGYRAAALLGFKPALWKIADLERQADPAQEGLDVWIGLVDLRPMPGNDIFEGGIGAVTNACALGRGETDYRRLVEAAFGGMGLKVGEIEDLALFRDRAHHLDFDNDLFEVASGLTPTDPVAHDRFNVYTSEGE